MKRSKIMLTAIGVLAVVGGALAFKANHFGAFPYCYTLTNTTILAQTTCPKGIRTITPSSIAIGAAYTLVKYTLTSNTFSCTTTPPVCTKIGRLTPGL